MLIVSDDYIHVNSRFQRYRQAKIVHYSKLMESDLRCTAVARCIFLVGELG